VKTTPVSEDGEGPSLFGPMVNVKVGDKSLQAVVIVAFGMADNVVSIPLGYGQGHDENWKENFIGDTPEYSISTANVSSVGVNTGFNGYALRGGSDYYASGISVETILCMDVLLLVKFLRCQLIQMAKISRRITRSS